ncbi:ABC transporter permease [Sediminicoccus sp. KRV36]|uniref:ABC transporter permease n=1 Tax=Sediminicoccus sp. KRV36 TaxID=3133721 RepID=UPI00200C2451|nr:ABC transporter permease [Sediminicoccus rosea]UPY36863.1 ABC transporter permease [Sediminicoccus rosea]
MGALSIGWKTRSRVTGWLLGALTIGFLLYQWLPVFTLALLSFSGPTGGTTFPMNGVSLHWYRELWDASIMSDFKPPLLRSVMLAAACSLTTCILAVMAAQAMRGRFRGHNAFFYLLLLGIMAPGLLVGFGFALLARILEIEPAWNTTGFIVHVTWTLPFGFMTMLAIFNRFDSRLEEAALTLGATRIITFRRITLPIVLPGVLGAALFGFSLSYDEFPRSMFTTGADMTLPLAVMAQLDRQLTPELYAIGTATTLTSLLAILGCVAGLALLRRTQRLTTKGT